jgi:hypothetical protein
MGTSPSQTTWAEQTSSSLFLLGSALWFSTLTLGASNVWLNAGFGTALGLLFFSIFPQITLDLNGRSHPHSRYVRSADGMALNLLQSFIFGAGVTLQALSFGWLLADGDVNVRTFLNLLAACAFLGSGFLTIVAHGCCCFRGISTQGNSLPSGHFVGNNIYITATVILFLAALEIRNNPNEFLGFFQQIFAALLLTVAGIIYLFSTKRISAVANDPQTDSIPTFCSPPTPEY